MSSASRGKGTITQESELPAVTPTPHHALQPPRVLIPIHRTKGLACIGRSGQRAAKTVESGHCMYYGYAGHDRENDVDIWFNSFVREEKSDVQKRLAIFLD